MRELIMVAVAVAAIVWEVQNDFAAYHYVQSLIGMATESSDE